MRTKNERIGEISYTLYGTPMKIIEYNTVDNILIEFQDDYKFITKGTYRFFKKGIIKNPYDKSVYGVGIVGEEKVVINGTVCKEYNLWHNMITRCYNQKLKEKHNTYVECNCCKDWLYYPNFKKWYNENKWDSSLSFELDKDILIKNNKIYSPDTCLLVDHRINCLILNNKKIRGKFPQGMSKNKNRYKVMIDKKNVPTYLGEYKTVEEAFSVYKKEKEKYIKEVAEYYKNTYAKFPKKIYKAMINYKIEISD